MVLILGVASNVNTDAEEQMWGRKAEDYLSAVIWSNL